MGDMLTDAASQLATRPDEEHYPSLAHLIANAQAQKDRSHTHATDDRAVFFVPGGVELGGTAVRLNHYSARQVGGLAGVPAGLMDRMKPRTCAQVMNETFPRDHNGPDRRLWLVEHGTDDAKTVRAVTSGSYSRLWDADLFQDVDRWLTDSGWVPATPEINTDSQGTNIHGNTKPALFRSDRDSFGFFMGPREEDGGDFGGLRPGLMVWNSEVGAKTFGYRRFYFRGMCANFLIWDAGAVKSRKARHTRQVERVFGWFRRELQRIARPITTAELDRFQVAASAPFATVHRSREQTIAEAAERLYALRGVSITQAEAAGAIVAALDQELNRSAVNVDGLSFWDVANGLTWEAKTKRYANDRASLQIAAGAVLEAAGRSR